MAQTVEPNALLLQVMAHDLLAPLTAVKWQIELLSRPDLDTKKRATYLESVNASTKLGITLTKHAHVAGSVLIGSYVPNNEQASLSDVIATAAHDLHMQYERHGLQLETDIGSDKDPRQLDKALMGLYVWAVAKYFLTCVSANTTVSFRGVSGDKDGATGQYMFIVSAPDVPERDEYARLFDEEQAQDAYDQTYVFTKLIRAVAPMIGGTVHASTQANLLAIETVFAAA